MPTSLHSCDDPINYSLEALCPLNYSLEALCRFPGGGYTHAALKTIYNQLTVRQVFKTMAILRKLELLYTSSSDLRQGSPH